MNKIKFGFIGVFLLLSGIQTSAQQASIKETQLIVKSAIKAAYASSVQISPYDTVRNRPANGVFSGVAVSAEGHILTVAHATKPNELYQLTFPDGSKHIAKGLGRIAVKDSTKRKDLDLAMIKIIKPGKWAYAQMASNSDMKVGQPCISISFPGSFFTNKPNVRLGRIADTNISTGYFVSTCKMEPGDSGGPLFDGQGKLIGMHSWIEVSEERNFEVPVDLYRKYWSALNLAVDYKELPKEDVISPLALSGSTPTIPAIQDLVSVKSKLAASVVTISSSRAGTPEKILGTVINYSSKSGKQTFILSKSSMVGDDPEIEWEGVKIKLTPVRRDRENDLILFQAPDDLPKTIKLGGSQDSLTLTFEDLGKFLVSPLSLKEKKVGVVSSLFTHMPMKFSIGYFGASATFINEKITITDIKRRSPAARFLKLKDQITGINGVAISRPPEYGSELQKHFPGDSITVELVRDSIPMQVKMYLPAYPGPNHVASKFEGGRSARSDGFKMVIVQDAAVKAGACGGPVFDSEGRFFGINIARHSRTSTIIMPVNVILAFIKQNLIT